MVVESDKEKLHGVIRETLALLCRNGLSYSNQCNLEALIGLTLDTDQVVLININEVLPARKKKISLDLWNSADSFESLQDGEHSELDTSELNETKTSGKSKGGKSPSRTKISKKPISEALPDGKSRNNQVSDVIPTRPTRGQKRSAPIAPVKTEIQDESETETPTISRKKVKTKVIESPRISERKKQTPSALEIPGSKKYSATIDDNKVEASSPRVSQRKRQKTWKAKESSAEDTDADGQDETQAITSPQPSKQNPTQISKSPRSSETLKENSGPTIQDTTEVLPSVSEDLGSSEQMGIIHIVEPEYEETYDGASQIIEVPVGEGTQILEMIDPMSGELVHIQLGDDGAVMDTESTTELSEQLVGGEMVQGQVIQSDEVDQSHEVIQEEGMFEDPNYETNESPQKKLSMIKTEDQSKLEEVTHPDIPPTHFMCPICRDVLLKASRRRHMSLHEGRFNYVCSVCGKGCVGQSDLESHMVKHTGEKLYECNLCGRDFAYKRSLQKHYKDIHGKVAV